MEKDTDESNKDINLLTKTPLMPEKTERIFFIVDHYIRNFENSR
jgi:hypothetical protein